MTKNKRSSGSSRVKLSEIRGKCKKQFNDWFEEKYGKKMGKIQDQIFMTAFNMGNKVGKASKKPEFLDIDDSELERSQKRFEKAIKKKSEEDPLGRYLDSMEEIGK